MTTSDVTLVAASDDPGPGTDFHESSGRIWTFCKRNAISRNAIIHCRNTKRKINWSNTATLRVKVIGNRDKIISQH